MSQVLISHQKIQKVTGAGKIVSTDLIPFTRQVAGMLNAGMSILATFSTLEEQCTSPNFKAVLRGLLDSIEQGVTVSQAMESYPQVFDPMYVNMVSAGERSGQFAAVLARLATLMDGSAKLKRKVKSALTYPVVILSLAMLIAGGLITFVVPIFAEMFSGFGSELPAATQFLVDLSEFIKGYYYIILPVLGAIGYCFAQWKKTALGHLKFDTFKLKMPVFGDLNQKVAISRFCRLFSQMLNSGVPILESMDIVAKSLGNLAIEQSISSARGEVEQGNMLNAALEGRPFLPILMVRMIAAGEKSGRVSEMLSSIADTYDDEIETTLGTLTSLMEPFLMVFLGVVIGGIVVAMFLPIFKLGTVVG